MKIITIDFETFYSKEFSLSKLTTEEYIRSPFFEVIGVAVKVDNDQTEWASGTHDQIKGWLNQFDWENSAGLAHNAMFDGAILNWVFDIRPKLWLDTLSMARALHGVEVGGSLKALAERYNLGIKGTEVINAMGVRRTEFTQEGLEAYGDYCINDVDMTYKLFDRLMMGKHFPLHEIKLIDLTLRMFTEPVLRLDKELLEQHLKEVQERKEKLLTEAAANRDDLMSNPKFADLLRSVGVEPPLKISPTTGKETLALAKNDEGFLALTEHEDPIIQQLCAVRLGTKSTIEESRIERFIDVGKRNKGKLPIPLKYYGAHTGRWAGSDKVNFQNLPSRDKKKKALKNAVVAPDGHYVINCDSSQIEARVLAWLAGQTDVVEQFARGDDVYSLFATKIYGREISKKDPVERFVGKTCILGLGYGTGAAKLQHTLKTSPPGAEFTEEECKKFVDKYRELNDNIIALWRECDKALEDRKSTRLNSSHRT